VTKSILAVVNRWQSVAGPASLRLLEQEAATTAGEVAGDLRCLGPENQIIRGFQAASYIGKPARL
jgi:hypothetical protein